MCLNIPRASSLMSIPRSSRSMLRPPADDAPPPGGLRLDPEHPPPPSLPLPSLRRGLVPEVFPTRFSDGEGVVLMVGGRGSDVVLAHEVALGIAQFRAVRFQAQPTRHVGVSWVNTVGSCLCLLLDHRSQQQPGQHLQLYASDHYPSLPPEHPTPPAPPCALLGPARSGVGRAQVPRGCCRASLKTPMSCSTPSSARSMCSSTRRVRILWPSG